MQLRQVSSGMAAFFTIGVLSVGSAFAQTDAATAASGTPSAVEASMADKHFVKEALQGGMTEVQLGQMASEKGKSDDVKQFGQKMVEDHTRMGDQMKGVAGKIGVTPPEKISAKDEALKTKLQALSGDQFDKAYIRAMVADHKNDLREFSKEASGGQSTEVKEAATQGKQVITEHLHMIEQMAQSHHVMTKAKS